MYTYMNTHITHPPTHPRPLHPPYMPTHNQPTHPHPLHPPICLHIHTQNQPPHTRTPSTPHTAVGPAQAAAELSAQVNTVITWAALKKVAISGGDLTGYCSAVRGYCRDILSVY